jgi:hypothetical protein
MLRSRRAEPTCGHLGRDETAKLRWKVRGRWRALEHGPALRRRGPRGEMPTHAGAGITRGPGQRVRPPLGCGQPARVPDRQLRHHDLQATAQQHILIGPRIAQRLEVGEDVGPRDRRPDVGLDLFQKVVPSHDRPFGRHQNVEGDERPRARLTRPQRVKLDAPRAVSLQNGVDRCAILLAD